MKGKYFISAFTAIILLVSCVTGGQIRYGSNAKAGKYIGVNDIKLYYEEYGKGEPLLLLHGNGGSIANFTFQIPELSKHYRVIAVDSRAQGRSTDSDQEITYALMAGDMSKLIRKLHLGSVNVLGWSDGGNVGLELAYAHPEQVKKLITFGANYTHVNYEAPDDSIVMSPDDPMVKRALAIRSMQGMDAESLSPDPGRLPLIRKKLNDLMNKHPNFTPAQLSQIKIPVLVAAGDHDLISLDHTVSLFKSLPHAELLIVPAATHFVLLEQPEFANREIIKFLGTSYRDISRSYFFR